MSAEEIFARMTIALERIPTETYQSSEEWDMMGHWHDYIDTQIVPRFISETTEHIISNMDQTRGRSILNVEVNAIRNFLETVNNLRRGRKAFSDDDARIRAKKLTQYRRGLKLRTFRGNFLLIAGGAAAMLTLPAWGYVPQIIGSYALVNGALMLAHKTWLHATSFIYPTMRHVGAAVAYDDRALLRRVLRRVYVRERNNIGHSSSPSGRASRTSRREATRTILVEVLRYAERHRRMVIARHALAAGAALFLGPIAAQTVAYAKVQGMIKAASAKVLSQVKSTWNGMLDLFRVRYPDGDATRLWNKMLNRMKISGISEGTYKEAIKSLGNATSTGTETLKRASFRIFG